MSDKARFLQYVHRSKYPLGCWLWTGATVQSGAGPVGRFSYQGRTQWAPRVAYQLYKGPIRKGYVIRHKCDNPICVRPAHLVQGTHKQNAKDKVERGRVGRGGTGPRLDILDRHFVKMCLEAGDTTSQVAKAFGVSRQAISYHAKQLRCRS